MTQPTFSTLFSGGGVADCGFVAAGMKGLWAVEYDAAIADVYRQNFPGHDTHVLPVEEIDWRKLPRVDHGHVSPSCKNASRANKNAGECAEDITAGQAICRFIDVIRPSTFTLENVWGYRHFQAFRAILECLADRQYYVHYAHLNSADYGVPQTRCRLILRASLEPLPMLEPTHAENGLGACIFHDGLPEWCGWLDAINDLIPTLPESEFAPWQLARLPQDLCDFLIGGGNTNATIIDSVARQRLALPDGAAYRREPLCTEASGNNMTPLPAILAPPIKTGETFKAIGIDQSLTSTGAAWLTVDAHGHAHRETQAIVPPKGFTGGARLLFFHQWVKAELRKGVNVIAFEDSVLARGSGKVLAELLGVIKCAVADVQRSRPELIVVMPHNSHVKQFAVSHGTADKSLLVNKARELWPGVLPLGITKKDIAAIEDQSDALWMAEMAAHVALGLTGSNEIRRKLIAQYRAISGLDSELIAASKAAGKQAA